jgi:hypothetical protein
LLGRLLQAVQRGGVTAGEAPQEEEEPLVTEDLGPEMRE